MYARSERSTWLPRNVSTPDRINPSRPKFGTLRLFNPTLMILNIQRVRRVVESYQTLHDVSISAPFVSFLSFGFFHTHEPTIQSCQSFDGLLVSLRRLKTRQLQVSILWQMDWSLPVSFTPSIISSRSPLSRLAFSVLIIKRYVKEPTTPNPIYNNTIPCPSRYHGLSFARYCAIFDWWLRR